jgi:hypothetical protein
MTHRTAAVIAAVVMSAGIVAWAQEAAPATQPANPSAGNAQKAPGANQGAATPSAQTQPASAPAAGDQKVPTVDEIVQRTNYVSYYQGADGRAQVRMRVFDKQGHERVKKLTILRRDDDNIDVKDAATEAFKAADRKFTGDQKYYVYFLAPPEDKGTTFLVWKHVNGDDDRWLYLPNLDLVKRIAATDKRTSFVGSHFLYEDVSGRNVDLDTHNLQQVTDQYYVLRNTPKDPRSVEFAYYDMYILKETFLPAYTWYYDDGGTKYRQYTVLKWDRNKKFGYVNVLESKMEDTKMGGYTILDYSDIQYNVGLIEGLFTERYLKRPPYRFLGQD